MADSTSRFGFVAFAETWNGRLAMLGFVIGLGTELLTGQGILTQNRLGLISMNGDYSAAIASMIGLVVVLTVMVGYIFSRPTDLSRDPR